MSIKITSVAKALENNGIKILIHGMAGVGKTVFCATTGVKTLIISAESGLLSIAEAPSYIKTTVVKTIYELEQVYEYIENNPNEFDVIALDSISEIAEVLLADEKKNSKDPRQAYGNLSDRMLSIMRGFRDLPDVDVIMSCKQVRIKDEDTGVTRYVPSLPGQALTNAIGYLFDEVFCLRVEKDEDGDDYRTIQTGRDRNFEAKDRSGVLEMFEEPNAKMIFEKIRLGHPDDDEDEEAQEQTEEENEHEKGALARRAEKAEKESEQEDEEADDLSKAKEAAEKALLITKKLAKEKLVKDAEKAKAYNEKVAAEELAEKEMEEAAKEKVKPQEPDLSEEEETTEESGPLISNDSDKIMYLWHSASDAILKLKPEDEIDDDGNIDIITFKQYTEHKKRIAAKEE